MFPQSQFSYKMDFSMVSIFLNFPSCVRPIGCFLSRRPLCRRTQSLGVVIVSFLSHAELMQFTVIIDQSADRRRESDAFIHTHTVPAQESEKNNDAAHTCFSKPVFHNKPINQTPQEREIPGLIILCVAHCLFDVRPGVRFFGKSIRGKALLA